MTSSDVLVINKRVLVPFGQLIFISSIECNLGNIEALGRSRICDLTVISLNRFEFAAIGDHYCRFVIAQPFVG